MSLQSIVRTACAVAALAIALPAAADDAGSMVTPTFAQAIPNIPGKSLIAVVVDYPPGGGSLPHRHAGSAFIFAYVLAGQIESQVNDGPRQVYGTGESFYEPPGATHRVSRNASATEPARLLAVFVVDSGETTLTAPIQ